MIWLVGNRGMLGSDTESLLKQNALEVTATDKDVDITRIEDVKEFSRNKKVDTIINCASYTNVNQAETESEKAFLVNAEGVLNLSKIAREKGAVFIHVSTDYVFDGRKKTPYAEDDPVGPLSVYGASKGKAEEHIRQFLERYYILRTAWMFGRKGKNFVYTILDLFEKQDEVRVVNDQRGTPTYSADLARMILKIVMSGSDKFGLYHFTNEGETTWFDFACEIYRQAKDLGMVKKEVRVVPVSTGRTPGQALRPAYSVLSKEKVIRTFNVAIRRWKDALAEFLNGIRDQYR